MLEYPSDIYFNYRPTSTTTGTVDGTYLTRLRFSFMRAHPMTPNSVPPRDGEH